MGSMMGTDAEFDAIVAQLREGHLRPPIDRVYPIAEGRSAFGRLRDSAQFGKIVITI
jgi:NADPH:quinone reductase-like Zn-dependent oxidoreductase